MADDTPRFEDVKARLDEIANEVAAEGITLDAALSLYEEAVRLGLSACDLSEKDILAAPEEEMQPESSNDEAAAQADGEAPTVQADGEAPVQADSLETPAKSKAVEVTELEEEQAASEGTDDGEDTSQH